MKVSFLLSKTLPICAQRIIAHVADSNSKESGSIYDIVVLVYSGRTLQL